MLLIKNIAGIAGIYDRFPGPIKGEDMNHVPQMADAWLAVDADRIHSFGPMDSCPDADSFRTVIDARRGWILPCFCDSHTHLVYAGSRDGEFRDKISGLSYEEIARRGGGILNSADLLNDTSEDSLFRQASRRLQHCAACGTGAIEIKSGYALTAEGELKMLRVIRWLRDAFPGMEIRATFLGAHAVGRAYAGRQQEYVDHIIDTMLPQVAAEGLADFVDVFCDEGFFTTGQTSAILEAAAKFGIRGKIHANELAVSGGVQTGIKHNALSVDHLERITETEIEALTAPGVTTIPTMLPGASFFLGIPFGDGRRLIQTGAPLALASDYNPGSSPSGNMRFVWSLGCIRMRLTPEEAFNAVTVNGACAMGLDNIGAIFPGALASFYLTEEMPAATSPLSYLPYAFTEPLISRIFLKGHSLP